jgi:hypothetical protein
MIIMSYNDSEIWYKKCFEEVKEIISVSRGLIYMVAYKLYSFDEKTGVEFIGILPERRKDPKRITKESVLNWGRMILGNNGDGKKIFFKRVTIEDISSGTLGMNMSFSGY